MSAANLQQVCLRLVDSHRRYCRVVILDAGLAGGVARENNAMKFLTWRA